MASPPAFQALTVKFTGHADRIVTDFGVSVPFEPTSPPHLLPPCVSTRALWDTGASRSAISRDLVKVLNHLPSGAARVTLNGETHVSPTYVVNFYLPNRVAISGVIVTEFTASPAFGAIIGMDVIGLGDMALTNVAGNTCLSFRAPSIATIDYEAERNRWLFAGAGRNDPCPCGSGEKFKRCHGR
jgi:hypothetical protein